MPHTSGLTQHEVARLLGISQARVLQIEQSAYKKLRDNPEAQNLLRICNLAHSEEDEYPVRSSWPKL